MFFFIFVRYMFNPKNVRFWMQSKILPIIVIIIVAQFAILIASFNCQSNTPEFSDHPFEDDSNANREIYKIGMKGYIRIDVIYSCEINNDSHVDFSIITYRDLIIYRNSIENTKIDFINLINGKLVHVETFIFPLDEDIYKIIQYHMIDVDQDNDDDIIISGTNIPNGSSFNLIFKNDGGTFSLFAEYDACSFQLPEDDYHDLDMMNGYDLIFVGPRRIITYLNDGYGHFSKRETQYESLRTDNYFLSDLNGDDYVDIAFVNSDRVGIMFNNGTGIFAHPYYFEIPAPFWEINCYDVDNDGDDDIILADQFDAMNNDYHILLYKNEGLGLFNELKYEDYNFSYLPSRPKSVVFNDVDKDGYSELTFFIEEYSSYLGIMKNIEGTFNINHTNYYYVFGGAPIEEEKSIIFIDIDGDSYDDIVIHNFWNARHNESSRPMIKAIEVLKNDGTGNCYVFKSDESNDFNYFTFLIVLIGVAIVSVHQFHRRRSNG